MDVLTATLGRVTLKNPLIAGAAEHLIDAEGVRRALQTGVGRERTATKPIKNESNPKTEDIKTETLYLDSSQDVYTKTDPEEPDERRRTQRLA